jgi:hypothetical protein
VGWLFGLARTGLDWLEASRDNDDDDDDDDDEISGYDTRGTGKGPDAVGRPREGSAPTSHGRGL